MFSHHNHTVEVAKLLRMDQHVPAYLVAAALQSVMDRLLTDKLFCQFDVTTPVDFIEYLISPLTPEERTKVFSVTDAATGDTALR